MRELSKEIYHFEKFFSLSPDLLCVANIAGFFEQVNPAFTQLLGYSVAELLAKPFVKFIHPDDVANTRAEIAKLAMGEATIHFENRLKCKKGEFRWFSWKAYYETETGLLYAIARDVTDKKRLETRLIELSRFDPLTGVFNRRAFTELCSCELRAAAYDQYPISVIIIDVDFFKEFNDNKGHIEGDRVLKRISHTLKKHLPKATDLISRYGGDEFLVLLSHADLLEAMKVAELLRLSIERLDIPYTLADNSDVLSITLGVTTIIPEKNYSVNQLIIAADAALYKAKKAGRNQVFGFDFGEV